MIRETFTAVIRNIRENLLTAVIVFLLSCFLTVALLISKSTALEKAMLQQVPLSIQMLNANVFTGRNGTLEKDVAFWRFYDLVEDISRSEEVTSSNYNLVSQYGFGDIAVSQEGEEYLYHYYVMGLNSPSFQREELLDITEGRMFTSDEIINGDRKAIVSDSMCFYINGEKRKAQPGDVIKVYNYTGYRPYSYYNELQKMYTADFSTVIMDNYQEMISVEVIGVYHANERLDMEENRSDYFDNTSYVLMPDNTLKETLNNRKGYEHFQFLSLNRVSFRFPDYDSYMEMRYEINQKLALFESDIRNEFHDQDPRYSCWFTMKDNGYERTINSISKIKYFYRAIFFIMSFFSVMALVFIMFYLLRKRKYEMMVYHALGQSKPLVILRLLMQYYMSLAIPALAGTLAAVGVTSLLQKLIINNSNDMQYLLLSYANNGTSSVDINPIQLDKLTIETVWPSLVQSGAAVLLIITVIVILFGSYFILMKPVKKRQI